MHIALLLACVYVSMPYTGKGGFIIHMPVNNTALHTHILTRRLDTALAARSPGAQRLEEVMPVLGRLSVGAPLASYQPQKTEEEEWGVVGPSSKDWRLEFSVFFCSIHAKCNS